MMVACRMFRFNKRCIRYMAIAPFIIFCAYVCTYHYNQGTVSRTTGDTDWIAKTDLIGQTFISLDRKSETLIGGKNKNPNTGDGRSEYLVNHANTRETPVWSDPKPVKMDDSIADLKHIDAIVYKHDAFSYGNNRINLFGNDSYKTQRNDTHYYTVPHKGRRLAIGRDHNKTIDDNGNSQFKKNVSKVHPLENTHAFDVNNSSAFDKYFENINMHAEKKFVFHGTRHSMGTQSKFYSMMSDYWKTVDNGIGKDNKLYQNGFNVDEVLMKMKTAKILDITFLLDRPTMKWILTLEGGQRVLFKPELNAPNDRCESGCEHPAFEITGFAINRMLGLNTMPFTTSRVLDWFKEIQHISTEGFKKSFKVFNSSSQHKDVRVCVKWTCVHRTPSLYCFDKGQISGSVMYWVNRDVLELKHYSPFEHRYSRFHPMHFKTFRAHMKVHALSTGDSRFCDEFRKKAPYNDSSNFLYILDMAVQDFLTQSKNSKHNIMYLNNTGSAFINVEIDKGKGFCRHRDDVLLAPVYQCCKIRRSVYLKLLEMNGSFVDRFMTETHLEPKDSIVSRKELWAIEHRIEMLLRYIDKCFALKGKENVLA